MRKRLVTFTRLLVVGVVCSLHYPATAQMLSRAEVGSSPHFQNAQKQSLKKALSLLESRFKVTFAFDERLISTFQVEDNLQGSDLELILDRVLPGINLKYQKIKNNLYVIGEKKNIPTGEGPRLNQQIDPNPAASTQAIQVIITGRITNDAGEGLPGVSVVLKGTTTGTATDSDGTYTLNLPDNQANGTLVFSFIGYTTEEAAIGNRTTINVSLVLDIKSLSEVLVIGYGTVKKGDVTGAVSSVKGETLNKSLTSGLDQALIGRVAGITAIQTSGQPGSSVSIRIRGTSSINGDLEPLYVIDGLPVSGNNGSVYDLGLGAVGGVGKPTYSPLSGLNPNDIESVEIC